MGHQPALGGLDFVEHRVGHRQGQLPVVYAGPQPTKEAVAALLDVDGIFESEVGVGRLQFDGVV